MHFLPDVYVQCDQCKGKRYNRETLEVKYKGYNIADVLEMTVDEATTFFAAIPSIADKMRMLQKVGLYYGWTTGNNPLRGRGATDKIG